jgi:hypothetical protein
MHVHRTRNAPTCHANGTEKPQTHESQVRKKSSRPHTESRLKTMGFKTGSMPPSLEHQRWDKQKASPMLPDPHHSQTTISSHWKQKQKQSVTNPHQPYRQIHNSKEFKTPSALPYVVQEPIQ